MELKPGESRTRLFTVLLVTFMMAAAVTAQVKAELIPGSNKVARDQALVTSVRSLELENGNLRGQVRAAADRIGTLNARLASQSTMARNLQQAIQSQRDASGFSAARGPGVVVQLASGRDPHTSNDTSGAWQVRYIDIQDVVNELWAAGAEGVSVNRQRVTAGSSFYVAGADVLLDGVHLTPPYEVDAIGDEGHFNQALGDENNLSELKNRKNLYSLDFRWHTTREIKLPAFDGAFFVRFAVAGQ